MSESSPCRAAWLFASVMVSGVTVSTVVLADSDRLVDPTRPPVFSPAPVVEETAEPAVEAATPKLQALFSQGGRYSALLDGRRLSAGDSAGDWLVVAIDSDGVTLEKEGQPMVLRMSGLGVKQVSREKKK